MTNYNSCTARRMVEEDLDIVLAWRNHPEIRGFMLSQHEISPTEHRNWFKKASQNESQALLIINDGKTPIGCVIFSNANSNLTTEWSFYSAPNSRSGTGKKICVTALNYAFREIGYHKVTGQVLDYNAASIRIHEWLGFTLEGRLREHCMINNNYHSIYYYGILSTEWNNYPFNK